MLTEDKKDLLATINGFGNERYADKVKKTIRNDLKMHPEEEIAILRKAVAKLFEVVSMLHHDEINNEEFAEYNNLIESIKQKYEVLKS